MATSSANKFKQKRKAITLNTRYIIIQLLENGKKQSEVCQEMNLLKSTVCAVWKGRDKILESHERSNYAAKRVLKSNHVTGHRIV